MAYDLIIIGGGPAGLTAGLFAGRRQLKTLILNDINSLSQTEEAVLIDDYPGLPGISGPELLKKFREQAKGYGVEIVGERAVKVSKTKTGFEVRTDSSSYHTKALILATGAKHRKAEVPGEERFVGKGVSYCASCDAPLFKGKQVLVIGGGDTALTDALLLDQTGAAVTIVHRRDRFRAAETLQAQLKKTKIKVIWNTVLVEIRGDSMVRSAVLQDVGSGQKREVRTDGIFIAIGTVPTSELARDLGIALDERGFIKVDKAQATNVPGIFAAGDCCDRPSKKIANAVGDGAVAAESAYEWIKSH